MAELKSTIEALEGYVYKISHDIKTPLTSLANFLTLYLRKKKPELDSESEHYFERIKGNIELMKNLIENVFENYTHVENRKPDEKDSVIEIEMK
jgi:signal transduction histidine kinase